MDVNDFFVQEPCNAAQCVEQLLGEKLPDVGYCGESDDCGALKAALAALPDETSRAALKHEFIKLAGTCRCGTLKSPACANWVKTAAELVRKYSCREAGGKPKVFLLGDSIRINYQMKVTELLAEECEIFYPAENCRFAKYALNELDRWFGKDAFYDVIHWNVGLWDSAVVCKEDGMFTSPQEYFRYMKLLHRELSKRAKHIIFATTTAVRDGSLNQHIEYVRELNDVIVPYMRSLNVPVNDLFELTFNNMERYLGPDCIHLSEEGINALGEAVAGIIRRTLFG